jgi:Rps23 Pro-64 3,4-dihydroxylase Tpa1-like proline 4-hydroxylase
LFESRKQIAQYIVKSIRQNQSKFREQYKQTEEEIGYFFVDDLLPKNLAQKIYESFPKVEDAVQKKSLREHKYVGYQMNEFDPLLEETIYAFQEPEVVAAIAEVCAIDHLEPDSHLYAGGISLMKHQNFLNPHLDNSHDKDIDKWRVLNLLYYVTPEWELEDGGNLELWPNGVKKNPLTIESKFNRLAVMSTHQRSWHSVSKVVANKVRCCVSNYYFSPEPLLDSDAFHVTTFRGRPEETSKNLILKLDGFLRGSLRKIFKKGVRKNQHEYKKTKS